MNNVEVSNIFVLAAENGYHKLVVRKDNWSDQNFCVVDEIFVKTGTVYGSAYGSIYYRDGTLLKGKIPGAGCYRWYIVSVLDDLMEVHYM